MFIVSLRLPKVTTLALETPRGFSEVFLLPWIVWGEQSVPWNVWFLFGQ